jgi:hypothetical protein
MARNQPIGGRPSVSVKVEPQRGAMYRALHVSRTVKTYPIQEHELYALDDLGKNSTLWTAISAATLALFASCVWDMIQLPAVATLSNGEKGFMGLLLVVTIGAFLMGRSYGKKRKSRLKKIMDECEQ